MSNEEGRKIYSEGLAKSFDMTKGSGVTLTIEDFGVYPYFACSSAHCIEVLDGAKRPALKLTFEIGAGVTQVKECLALIKASKYSGWISLEVGTRPPLDSAIQGAKYVTEAWK